jgi:hypothetical protein
MKIFGVSQTNGTERVLKIERGIDGLVLTLADHVGGKERARVIVPSDAFVGAIMEPTVGGSVVDGLPQPQGLPMQLAIEVKRNEVLLNIREENGVGVDVAVGSDDLQDALEGVTSRE